MAAVEVLTPQKHGRLRLRSAPVKPPHFVQTVTSEFAAAAISCPLLLTKNAQTGAFYIGAMFGFRPGECLVDTREHFQPLHLRRDGFFIAGDHIAVDTDNERFSETDGELLFDESLQPTPTLRHIQRALGQLQDGTEKTDLFIRELMQLKLIEPIDVSLSFDSGERLTLQGLYTVSLDRLHELPAADALRLFQSGYLQLIYTMTGSVNQIAVLANLRNRELGGATPLQQRIG
jgi:hypothetical protein